MISSDVIRGYNDIMILCLLLDGDLYGYEISKRINEITEEKYKITDQGKKYYVEKCLEWDLTKEVVERFIRRK